MPPVARSCTHSWNICSLLLCRVVFALQVVKNTAWEDLSNLHSGWLISQAWPSEVETTSFMFNLLDRTSSSISVLPVLSISFNNGKGTSAAKGISERIAFSIVRRTYAIRMG